MESRFARPSVRVEHFARQYSMLGQNAPPQQNDYSMPEPTFTSPHAPEIGAMPNLVQSVFAKPWHHRPDDDDDNDNDRNFGTARTFSRSQQRRRIFRRGLLQWLIPTVCCVLLFSEIYYYSSRETLSTREKRMYNAVTFGLTLCLGFSTRTCLQKLAQLMRWRILASRYWDPKHFQLIMDSSSQLAIVTLLWNGHRHTHRRLPPSVKLACLLYLTVAVGLQVSIALLGLSMSVEVSKVILNTVEGNVSVARLDSVVNVDLLKVKNATEQGLRLAWLEEATAARSYGIGATPYVRPKSQSGNEDSSLGNTIFYSPGNEFYQTYFFDRCPGEAWSDCGDLSVSTDRSVKSTSLCHEFLILSGGTVYNPDVIYKCESDEPCHLNVNATALSWTTTFLSRVNRKYLDCGSRCAATFVVNVGALNTENAAATPPQLFYCETTIGDVEGAVGGHEYVLPDEQARLFAGAIGWSGAETRLDDFQEVAYPSSNWSWNGAQESADQVADKLMRFSIGAIAAMDQNGERMTVWGASPRVAEDVKVEWKYMAWGLSVIPGLLLLVLVCVTVLAGTVVILDGDYLSNAHLLQPLLGELHHDGRLLTGGKSARPLDERTRQRIRYATTLSANADTSNEPRFKLCFLVEAEKPHIRVEKTWLSSKNMPEGIYDWIP